jgi:PAS domain S-box-containing protein
MRDALGRLTERAVIDALPRAVVVTNPAGVILLWNEQAELLFGWPELDVLGRSVLDVLAPADDLDANRQALVAVAAGNNVSGDRLVVRRDGTFLRVSTVTQPVLDDAGHVIAILGTSTDVTELRDAEQRARDLVEHFGSALEAGGLGTWRWDIATGHTAWDERLEALFGLPPGGFDGTFEMYVSLLDPDDREHVLDTVRRAVESKSPYRVEHKVVWPDGSTHWIAGAGTVTLDERGVVTGTVGCSMDVTDRVSQEVERHRLAAIATEAAASERLQRERLEFVAAINDALHAASNVHEIMVNVTTQTVPRLGDWCSIHVLPFQGGLIPDVEIAHVDPAMVTYARQLNDRFPYRPDAATGVAKVIRTGRAEFYPDITDVIVDDLHLTDDERDILTQLALRSAISVPLTKRGRVLGAMQFVMSSSSRRYTEDDLALARTVADRIASSIENFRLLEQQRAIAHTLQQSLLPAALPDIPGVEIAVRYWPAGEANTVGGDFYDVFALATHRWAVVIGDVCGTGPASAALTGLARHTIRDSAWHGDRPVEVLASLNRAVLNSGAQSFLTAIYASLDSAGPRPELTVACGGHPLPIHVSRQGAAAIGSPGKLLGMFEDARGATQSIALEPGDAVVFYTDGATDVRPPHWLDSGQFTAIVAQAAQDATSAEAVADRLHEALEIVLPFKHREDDIALLVLRMSGETTSGAS